MKTKKQKTIDSCVRLINAIKRFEKFIEKNYPTGSPVTIEFHEWPPGETKTRATGTVSPHQYLPCDKVNQIVLQFSEEDYAKIPSFRYTNLAHPEMRSASFSYTEIVES